MHKNFELREIYSTTSSKKFTRCRSFHFRYLELCRSKNLTPLPEIRSKGNATSVLDFYGDKLGVNDWLMIVESLFYDQVLQILCIRLRKSWGPVLDHLDNEKKAKLYRQKPSVYTKFVFSGIVESVSNCVEFNKNLKVLNLEGLPLADKYVESIAKALSSNDSITDISFQRSFIGDRGCEAICNTIKYLENVEKLNLADCNLTNKGADCVADMIKIQKISRYTEGWQKSLRYRDVDPETIPGLRCIILARNPDIGDDGLKRIIEILKEDVWVKVMDMENCGLTDRSANLILDCLEINHYILEFNVRGNADISKFLQRSIREQLGKEEEDQRLLLEGQNSGGTSSGDSMTKKPKVSVAQLKDQVKSLEEKLAFERMLRKKAEQLNAKLNQQILAYEVELEERHTEGVPPGYVAVRNESLQSIIKERNELQRLASTRPNTPREHPTQTPEQSSYGEYYDKSPIGQSPMTSDMPSSSPSATMSMPVFYDEQESTDCQSTSSKEARKILKVRKVKSEMKYIDAPQKDGSKKKESKSDHEFANETDFRLTAVHFETNIGDTMDNTLCNNPGQMTARTEQPTLSKPKYEMDDLSISTHSGSSHSSDSDTLRNTGTDFQPLRVFIRRSNSNVRGSHHSKTQEFSLGDGVGKWESRDAALGNCTGHYGHGMKSADKRDGGGSKPKTPRSLFWGYGDE